MIYKHTNFSVFLINSCINRQTKATFSPFQIPNCYVCKKKVDMEIIDINLTITTIPLAKITSIGPVQYMKPRTKNGLLSTKP